MHRGSEACEKRWYKTCKEREEVGEGLRGVETDGSQRSSFSKKESFIMQPRRKDGGLPSIGAVSVITF